MMRLRAGQPALDFAVEDVFQRPVTLQQYAGKKLLLSFYRSPACPLCSVRLYHLVKNYSWLHEFGLEVVTIFEASYETIHKYMLWQHPLFPLIADPQKTIFRRYGVQAKWLGMLGMLRIGTYFEAWRRHVGGRATNGELAMIPADFLINPDLTIHRAGYGRDIGDYISLQEIGAFASCQPSSQSALLAYP